MDEEPLEDQPLDENSPLHPLDFETVNLVSVKEEVIEDVHMSSNMEIVAALINGLVDQNQDQAASINGSVDQNQDQAASINGSVDQNQDQAASINESVDQNHQAASINGSVDQNQDQAALINGSVDVNQDQAASISGSVDQHEYQSVHQELPKSSLDSNQVSWIKNHNEEVKRNREVFKVLISAINFLCKQDLVFRTYDEPTCDDDFLVENNSESGLLKSTFELVTDFNKRIKEQWDNRWYFARIFENNDLQTEIIECFHHELWSFIEASIREAPFFACILDAADYGRCSVTVRLVDSDGDVREYFIGFYNLDGDVREYFIGFYNLDDNRTSENVCNVLREAFEQFDMKNKLVAQSYDGHCLLTGDLGDILTKTQKIAPQAMLTHNSSHHLYHVLEQSCSKIGQFEVYTVLDVITRLPVFFHDLKSKNVLDSVLDDVFPSWSKINLDSNSEVISAILTNKEKVIEVLEVLSESSFNDLVFKSNVYIQNLEDFIIVFLLFVFQKIFDETDTLLIPVQKMSSDLVVACIHNLKSLKNDEQFEEFMQLTEPETGPFSSSDEFVRLQKKGINPTEYLKKIYFDVLDDVTAQLDARFSRCEELSFLQLGDARKFARYHKRFPTQALNSLMNSFGDRFNEERLKLELETIFSFYQTNRSKTARLSKMIKQMANDGRKESLPEAFKLFTLIATIPASKLKSGSTFSRIQSYMELARHLTEERCSALALVSIEKEILLKVQNRESWYDDIVERFAKMKERLIPLLYK